MHTQLMLNNPFRSFDPATVLYELNSHKPIDDLYKNNNPYAICFLGNEARSVLTKKINEYQNSFFRTLPPKDENEPRDLKSQLEKSRIISARQQRAQQTRLLANQVTWAALKESVVPTLRKVADKLGYWVKQSEMVDSLLKKNENKDIINQAEHNFHPYVEFLAFPPKALIFAWNILLEIEKHIAEAQEEVSKRKNGQTDIKGKFLKQYRDFLNGFEQDIQSQKKKIWTATQKILESLQRNALMTQLDPMAQLAREFKEAGVSKVELPGEKEPFDFAIPEVAESILPEEIDGLFSVLSKQPMNRAQDWGSLVSYPSFPGTQLPVYIGACKEGTVTYPAMNADVFNNLIHVTHSWPTFRGIAPSMILKFNIATKSYKPTASERQLHILIPALKIIIDELAKLEKPPEKQLEEKEKDLSGAWKHQLVLKGLILLTCAEHDWNNYLKDLRDRQTSESEDIIAVGQFIQIINKECFRSIVSDKRDIAVKFAQTISQLEKEALLNLWTCSMKNLVSDQKHWEIVLEACQKATNQDFDKRDLLLAFFRGKNRANIEDIAKLLQKEGIAQPREYIRHFINTKLIEIDNSKHYLYQPMLDCDRWFYGTGGVSLQTSWLNLRESIITQKLEAVMSNLDKPEIWPNFAEDECASLSEANRQYYAGELLKLVQHREYRINHPAKWEAVLNALTNSELTHHYLVNILEERFFKLIDPLAPIRANLIRASHSFLIVLEKAILNRFAQNLDPKKASNREIIQDYVETFFGINHPLFESLDGIYFNHICQKLERGHPDRNLLTLSSRGYLYPKSESGFIQLKSWINQQPVLPWNPAIWSLITKGCSKDITLIEQKWRATWMMNVLKGNELDSVKHMVPHKLAGMSGPEYFESLFGNYSREILTEINARFVEFCQWVAQEPDAIAMWVSIFHECTNSQNQLAFEIHMIQRKLELNPQHKLQKQICGNLNDTDKLCKVYQESFAEFLIKAINNPANFSPEVLYDGLATVLLYSGDDLEWRRNFLKNGLTDAFNRRFLIYKKVYAESANLPWDERWNKLPEEVRRHGWLYKIGLILEQTNWDQLNAIRLNLTTGNITKELLNTPDWVLSPLFENDAWCKVIPLLPSRLRHKLLVRLNRAHLPSLRQEFWQILNAARFVLETGAYNSPEGCKIHEYRNKVLSISRGEKAHFEPIASERRDTLMSWRYSLARIGISPMKNDTVNANSWFLGPTWVDDDTIKTLTESPKNKDWKSVNDLHLIPRSSALSGLLFEDLFLLIFCGHQVVPYDIIHIKEGSSYLLKYRFNNTTSFEMLEKAKVEWDIEDHSFGARFILELIFGSVNDHHGYYHLVPAGQNTYKLDRVQVEFPDVLNETHELPKPQEPTFSDRIGNGPFVESETTINQKQGSFIFSLKNQMQKRLPPELIKWFCELKLDETFTNFMFGLIHYNNRLGNLFEEPDHLCQRLQWSSRFNGHCFSQEKVETAFQKLQHLQEILRSHPESTLDELLCAFDPLKAAVNRIAPAFSITNPPFNSVQMISASYAHREIHLAMAKFGRLFRVFQEGSRSEISFADALRSLPKWIGTENILKNLCENIQREPLNSNISRTLNEHFTITSKDQLREFIRDFVEFHNETATAKISLRQNLLPGNTTWKKIYMVASREMPLLGPWIINYFRTVQELHLNENELTTMDLRNIAENSPLLTKLNISDSTLNTANDKDYGAYTSPARMIRRWKQVDCGFVLTGNQFFFPNLKILQADRLRVDVPFEIVIVSRGLCHVSFKDSLALITLGIGFKQATVTADLRGTVLAGVKPKVPQNAAIEGWNRLVYEFKKEPESYEQCMVEDNALVLRKMYSMSLYHNDNLIMDLIFKHRAIKCLAFYLQRKKDRLEKVAYNPLLVRAYNEKKLDLFEFLIPFCLNPIAVNEFGQNLLQEAIHRGHKDFAKLLMKHPQYVFMRDPEGVTALHLILKEDAVDLYDPCIGQSIPFDNKSHTPLHYAAMENSWEMASLWLEQFDPEMRAQIISMQNDVGATALHLAALNGHESFIVWLLQKEGCNIFTETKAGNTILDWAAGNGQDNVVSYLLNLENVGRALDNQSRALEFASKNKHESTVELLNYFYSLWFNPLFESEKTKPSIKFGKRTYTIETPTSGIEAILGGPFSVNSWLVAWQPSLDSELYRNFILLMKRYLTNINEGYVFLSNWPFDDLRAIFGDIMNIRSKQDAWIERLKGMKPDIRTHLVKNEVFSSLVENLLDYLSKQNDATLDKIREKLLDLEEEIMAILNTAEPVMKACRSCYLEQIRLPNYQFDRDDLTLVSIAHCIPVTVVTNAETDRDLPTDHLLLLQHSDNTYSRLN